MGFAAYVPPQAEAGRKLPVLYWLSGLTCTPEIFMTEAQAQGVAARHGVILVAPDTSPRETGIPGEAESYDLGTGASFYVDATEKKWSRHFQMDSYVTKELRRLVEELLPIDRERRGIFGHSMGGHGALALGLRNPDLYRSISAFAPICAPSRCPWGTKAFGEYLGSDRKRWAAYDTVELLRTARGKAPILVDQGTDDEFLERELSTDALERGVKESGYPAEVRRQAGYDHSYFFISTFLEEHVAFHLKALGAR
jgi:S-formylglutathione hydrolase